MTFAGLKKCRPMTSCGRPVDAAISFTSSVEVLVARIAPGLQIASSLPKISFLTAMFSNTASITMSASAASSIFRLGVSSPMRVSTSSMLSRPRLAVPS